jgi:hypothetical protein
VRARAASTSSVSFPLTSDNVEVSDERDGRKSPEHAQQPRPTSENNNSAVVVPLKVTTSEDIVFKTEPKEMVLERLIEHVPEDHDEPEPLTATRISMDVDSLIRAGDFLKPHDGDTEPDFDSVDYKKVTPNSTPLSTPQLSHTTMSTPRIETPQVLPMGLGVHGLTMGFEHVVQHGSEAQTLYKEVEEAARVDSGHPDRDSKYVPEDDIVEHHETGDSTSAFSDMQDGGMHSHDLESHPFSFDDQHDLGGTLDIDHGLADHLEMQRHHDEMMNSYASFGNGDGGISTTLDDGYMGLSGSTMDAFAGMI